MVNLVQVLQRAIAMLNCFPPTGHGLTVGEIAAQVHLTRSTTHRILSDLRAAGLIDHDAATQKYRLGIRIVQLAHTVLQGLDLPRVAAPILDELAARTRETVILYQLTAYQRVAVFVKESPHTVRVSMPVGATLDLYPGSGGTALLAHLPADDVRQVLSRHFGDDEQGLAALQAELEGIRERGYALSIRVRLPDSSGVASAVFDAGGRAVASVSVGGPVSRVTAETLPQLGEMARQAAAEISRRLGWSGAGAAVQ